MQIHQTMEDPKLSEARIVIKEFISTYKTKPNTLLMPFEYKYTLSKETRNRLSKRYMLVFSRNVWEMMASLTNIPESSQEDDDLPF